MIKRYNIVEHSYGDGDTSMDVREALEGQYVEYEDIKQLLQNTSSNSDYAKFPTIVAIVDNLNGGKNLGWTCGDVEPIVKAIKELGNFA